MCILFTCSLCPIYVVYGHMFHAIWYYMASQIELEYALALESRDMLCGCCTQVQDNMYILLLET